MLVVHTRRLSMVMVQEPSVTNQARHTFIDLDLSLIVNAIVIVDVILHNVCNIYEP